MAFDFFLITLFGFFSFSDFYNSFWIVIMTISLLLIQKIYFFRYDFWVDLKKIFKSLILSLLIVVLFFFLSNNNTYFSFEELSKFFILNLFFFPIFKRYSKKILFRNSIFKLKVKIVANEPHKSILKTEIKNNWYLGLENTYDNYQIVIISSNKFSKEKLEKILNKYSAKIKDVFVIPYLDNLDLSYSNILDYSNVKLSAIHIENRLLNKRNVLIKYMFEKFLVILAFPLVILVHLFICYLIKKDSSGPILFKQKRLGMNGKIFRVYKYRTMFHNQNEILNKYLSENPEEIEYYNLYHKYKNDPRITKIGKFLRNSSLDEFPQFYNILRGDMNLIGPRPYMIEEKNVIGKGNRNILLKVKPGLTGLWQVSGRNDLTFQRRVELEKWYIKNWSLWMDFVIFIKTIKVVLLKIGAK